MTYLFIIVNVSISSGKILEINLAIIAGLINFNENDKKINK